MLVAKLVWLQFSCMDFFSAEEHHLVKSQTSKMWSMWSLWTMSNISEVQKKAFVVHARETTSTFYHLMKALRYSSHQIEVLSDCVKLLKYLRSPKGRNRWREITWGKLFIVTQHSTALGPPALFLGYPPENKSFLRFRFLEGVGCLQCHN